MKAYKPFQNGSSSNETKFYELKDSNILMYYSLKDKLDELTTKGYSSLQIEEMLNLGERKYLKNKNKLKDL